MALQNVSSSCEAGLLVQEHEGALLKRSRLLERGLSEFTVIPELKPLKVVGSLLDIVLVSVVLEEELLVTPQGRNGLRAGHEPADVALFATDLRRLVVAEDPEHGSVGLYDLELLVEVVLVGIGPSVHVVWLNVDLEGPVVVDDLVAVLVELGKLHDGHGAGCVGHFGQVLADGLSGALVVHLLKDVGPPVAEEVEGRLAVEGKHGEPVGRGHAVSEELHAVARSGLWDLGGCQSELRDSHDGVLASLEDSGVGSVVSGNELHESGGASGVRSLDAAGGHRVGDVVERQVHVLLKEALELVTYKESFRGEVSVSISPDNLLFAVGTKSLVFSSVKEFVILECGAALAILSTSSELLRFSLSSRDGGHQHSRSNGEFHLNSFN